MGKSINIKNSILLLLFFIYENSFFGCNLINNTLQGRSRYVVSLILILYFIVYRKGIRILPKEIRRCFWAITLIPLVSMFNSYFYQDQPFSLSILSWLGHNTHFLFLAILITHKIKINEILLSIRFYALIYSILTLLQVYVPSSQYLFASYYEDGSLFMRNDMIRIVMPGISFVLFAYIESLYRYLSKGEISQLLLFVLFLVTIYLRQTRQSYFAIAVVSLIMFINFYFKTKHKRRTFVFVAILAAIMFANFNELFGIFISQTQSEFNDADYNRWKSFDYFFGEIFSNIPVLLLGMGKAAMNTQYADKINNLWIYSGISRNDVGIIGEWYNFGIFYVIAYLSLVYCIVSRYFKQINPIVRYFAICTFCHCIFVFPLDDVALWTCVIYISINSIKKNEYCINSNYKSLHKPTIFGSK